MKHTEGPWLVRCGSVYNGVGIPIAHMDRSPENGTLPVERDANAHFIARACNAHYALRGACLSALHRLAALGDDGDTQSGKPSQAYQVLQRAIAKAEGRD